MSKEKMKAYPVRLPADVVRKLDLMAECVVYDSRSSIIRYAVTQYLRDRQELIEKIDQNQAEVKP